MLPRKSWHTSAACRIRRPDGHAGRTQKLHRQAGQSIHRNLADRICFYAGRVLKRPRKLTWEEQAILTSLQLYALHQQGKSESVALQEETDKWENMGHSLRTLRTGDEKAVDRRFNALITAANYEELVHHLRQMIKLLKAKTDTKVNYAKLADDLYGFLRNYPETMRIRWAKAYYRTTMKKGEEDEQ